MSPSTFAGCEEVGVDHSRLAQQLLTPMVSASSARKHCNQVGQTMQRSSMASAMNDGSITSRLLHVDYLLGRRVTQ